MKLFKKVLLLVLTLTIGLTIVGCNSDSKKDDPNKEDPIDEVVKVEVTFETFGGTSISKKEVNKGETINEPSKPEKDGATFVAWDSDSSFTKKVSFPLIVTQDIKLYAKFEEGTYYEVTFFGTNMASKNIKEGEKLAKPNEPVKENHIFGGWYLDSSYSIQANFPLTITKDTVIYAEFYDYKTAFIRARENTMGTNVPGYEYDYTLVANANLSKAGLPISLNGNTNGNTKYSKTSATKFYDAHFNSGSLFYDGSVYKLLDNNTLRTIKLNEDDVVTKVELEQVDANYTHDSSTFAKALFEYGADDIVEIRKTANPDEYQLITNITTSSVVAMVCNSLNSSIVEKALGKLPDTIAGTTMFVKFADGKIKSYKFIFAVQVDVITFSITYELIFKNIGANPTITPKTFPGLAITEAEINSKLNAMNSIMNNYQTQEKSSYDFEFKSAIDYGATKAEVNSKFKGSTMRKVTSDKTYFHNIIDITSNDYKKSELYKNKDLDDIKIHKSMLANGEVWLIEKKVLRDDTKQVTPYVANRLDQFYLFDLYKQATDINYIQTSVDSKTGETIYAIGITHESLVSMLNWLNNNLDVDPFEKASIDVKLFGDFKPTSIKVEEAELQIRVKDNKLTQIYVLADGLFETKYAGSAEYTSYQEVQFDFEYTLTTTNKGLTYEPFTKVNDAK